MDESANTFILPYCIYSNIQINENEVNTNALNKLVSDMYAKVIPYFQQKLKASELKYLSLLQKHLQWTPEDNIKYMQAAIKEIEQFSDDAHHSIETLIHDHDVHERIIQNAKLADSKTNNQILQLVCNCVTIHVWGKIAIADQKMRVLAYNAGIAFGYIFSSQILLEGPSFEKYYCTNNPRNINRTVLPFDRKYFVKYVVQNLNLLSSGISRARSTLNNWVIERLDALTKRHEVFSADLAIGIQFAKREIEGKLTYISNIVSDYNALSTAVAFDFEVKVPNGKSELDTFLIEGGRWADKLFSKIIVLGQQLVDYMRIVVYEITQST